MTMDRASNLVKNHSTDRKFMLKPMEGKPTLNTLGQVDNRLFTGENNIHAQMTPEGMWYIKLDHGIVPKLLQQHFTSFNRLLTYMTDYFKRRNVEITEVIDVW